MAVGQKTVTRAETRNSAWKQSSLVCQVKEFGFLPADNRKPRDVFKQANTTHSFSFDDSGSRAEDELQ